MPPNITILYPKVWLPMLRDSGNDHVCSYELIKNVHRYEHS